MCELSLQAGHKCVGGGRHCRLKALRYALLNELISSISDCLCCVQAKVLMKTVDNVSLGMGGAADTLLLSAKLGDPNPSG